MKAKVMILVNVLLSLLYVYSSYEVWNNVNNWSNDNVASNWAPTLISPHFISSVIIPPMVYTSLVNTPFILFWIIFAVNLYFILELQRSKETKQNFS
jgi:hypothetical protein